MARAVVLGANGFLGSHLVDALAAAGHTVRAFDRFSTQQPHFTASDVEVLRGEFLSRADIDAAVRGQDLVFHFLSTTTPATAESDPILDVRTNVAPTVELLESCARAGVKRFYYASTGGAMYGRQHKQSYRESDHAQPVSPYGIGKLTIEHYLHYFEQLHQLRATVLRLSNPYGYRQQAKKMQGLIPIVLRQIVNDQPVTVFGDGSMVRDYVWVDDAITMIMNIVSGTPKHTIYHIGSGVGHSVNQVIATIAGVLGKEFRVETRATPATFVDHVVLNIERYVHEFGPASATSLSDGIAAVVREMGVAR